MGHAPHLSKCPPYERKGNYHCMIKLIAIDLDGTLLNRDKHISDENIKALHYANEKGVKIILCTGRPYFAMKEFVQSIGFTKDSDYIITFNGGYVQKAATGEVLVENTLTKHDIVTWYAEAMRLDLPIVAIDSEKVYEPHRYPTAYPSLYLQGTQLPHATQNFHAFDDTHLFNKMVIAVEQEHLDAQIPKLDPDLTARYEVAKSRVNYLEILKKGVSKGRAMAQLGELLDITQDEMMGIGDQENDLSMIQYARIGVAMANAIDIVKAQADYVTDTNDQDGVAKAIYHFVNGR